MKNSVTVYKTSSFVKSIVLTKLKYENAILSWSREKGETE